MTVGAAAIWALLGSVVLVVGASFWVFGGRSRRRS